MRLYGAFALGVLAMFVGLLVWRLVFYIVWCLGHNRRADRLVRRIARRDELFALRHDRQVARHVEFVGQMRVMFREELAAVESLVLLRKAERSARSRKSGGK